MAIVEKLYQSERDGAIQLFYSFDDQTGGVTQVRAVNTTTDEALRVVISAADGSGWNRDFTVQPQTSPVIDIPGGQQKRFTVIIKNGVPFIQDYKIQTAVVAPG